MKKFLLFTFISSLILLSSCQKDFIDEHSNESEISELGDNSASNKYKSISEKIIKNQALDKSLSKAVNDSLIWEKGLMLSRNDTIFYTVPYKHSTDKIFFNLYIEKAKDYLAIFKFKYLKGPEYRNDKHNIKVKVLPFKSADTDFNFLKENLICSEKVVTLDLECTGSGNHSVGDGSCLCGISVDCKRAYSATILTTYCVVSSGGSTTGPIDYYSEDPYATDGNYEHGSNYEDDGTTVAIDPNDNMLFYNMCKTNNGDDCFKYCDGSIDCEQAEDELNALRHKLKISIEESISLAEHTTEMLQYIADGGSVDLARDFAKINYNYEEVRFDRFRELDSIVKADPWALVEDCIQSKNMEKNDYVNLFEHDISQECEDYLDNLNGFKNQPIEEGTASLANVDYYGVEITQMPDFGRGYATSEELFTEFKKEFSTLASGQKEDFSFKCESMLTPESGDIEWSFSYYPALLNRNLHKWNGLNPLTTLFLINGAAPNNPLLDEASDHGAIIISEISNNSWIGSTIITPESGSQPFSGNREWGYKTNSSGNVELFTRAVDVAKISGFIKWATPPFAQNNECKDATYYAIANATWESFQSDIKSWIEANGGTVNIKSPKVIKVKKEYLIEILSSEMVINSMLCE